MTEKDNNNLIILALGIVGIALGFFAYLVYTQNRDKQQYQQLQLSNTQQLQPDFKMLIENQNNIITNQQEQIDKIYTLNDNIVNIISNNINKVDNKSKPIIKDLSSVAGSATNLKVTPQDKIRQTKFGLL